MHLKDDCPSCHHGICFVYASRGSFGLEIQAASPFERSHEGPHTAWPPFTRHSLVGLHVQGRRPAHGASVHPWFSPGHVGTPIKHGSWDARVPFQTGILRGAKVKPDPEARPLVRPTRGTTPSCPLGFRVWGLGFRVLPSCQEHADQHDFSAVGYSAFWEVLILL